MGERQEKCRMTPGWGSDLSGMDDTGPVIPGDDADRSSGSAFLDCRMTPQA